jgi:hypothetical protein
MEKIYNLKKHKKIPVVSAKAPRGSLFLVKVKGRKLNKKQHVQPHQSTSVPIKRNILKKGKRVHFKGNGNIKEMVEVVNVVSYKEYNLDLANSDYHEEDTTKATCSCQIY